MQHTKTRSTRAATIGVRKAPAPQGRPGFIRIDSVHQGDQDGHTGLYHINAVDCVTQWQVVATVQNLSEAFLLPVLEQMLGQFPLVLLGFHADNGSEFVNHQVAGLLEKLRIEFTRSHPRHSNVTVNPEAFFPSRSRCATLPPTQITYRSSSHGGSEEGQEIEMQPAGVARLVGETCGQRAGGERLLPSRRNQ